VFQTDSVIAKGEMTMRNEFLVVAVGAALSVGLGQAIASDTIGEIKRLNGSAMISHGEHFIAAREGMKLQELDRLMVLEQSDALVEFQDGCQHLMKEQELLTVGTTSVCVDNPNSAQTAAENASDVQQAQQAATAQLEAGPGGGLNGELLLFGAVAGGGLIASIINGTGSDDFTPRPPISPQ
jgi:hypothetical protein